MIAEVVHHFAPSLVEKHNYQSANSTKGKKENWMLFDRSVRSPHGEFAIASFQPAPELHEWGCHVCAIGGITIEFVWRSSIQPMRPAFPKRVNVTSA